MIECVMLPVLPSTGHSARCQGVSVVLYYTFISSVLEFSYMTSFCKSFTPTNSLIKSGMVLNLKCFIQNSCHTSGTDHYPLRTRLLWEIFIIYYLYLCLFRWVRNRWDVPFLVDNAPTRKAECIETISGGNIFSNFLGWVVPKSFRHISQNWATDVLRVND